jgi:spore coat polysaccharide biosynthesis predicted glycosyltransferase SpsG
VVNLESFNHEPTYANYVLNPQRETVLSTPDNHLPGTDYLVARDEFHEQTADIGEQAENILVTFGGSDPLNLTTDAVEALGQQDPPFSYRLVVGPDFSHESDFFSLTMCCHGSRLPEMTPIWVRL